MSPFLSVFQQDPLPFEDDTVVEQIAISLPFSLFSAPSLSIFNPSINAYVPHSIFHCSSYLCPISFIFATDCLSCLTGHQIRAFHSTNDKHTGGGGYFIRKQ